MGLFDTFTSLTASGSDGIEATKSLTRSFLSTVAGPQYPDRNFGALSRSGYEKNTIAYSCIEEKANAFNQARFTVFRRGADGTRQSLPRHEAAEIIRRPNGEMSSHELNDLTMKHLLIFGNAFWQKIRPRSAPSNGAPVELWPLNPLHMRIRTDQNNQIARYEYRAGEDYVPVDPDDIIHFRYPHPRKDDHWGFPPMGSILREVVSDNEGTDFMTSMLQNSAVPGIVVQTNMFEQDEDRLDRLKRQWRQNYGGDSRGEPAFLPEGMEVEDISHTFREMEFPDLRKQTEVRICAAFKVPPIVAGFRFENTTYNNYENARRSFWEEGMEPIFNLMASKLEVDLLNEWGDGLRGRYDVSDIPALRDVRKAKIERATTGFQQGILTLNEAREMAGFEPLPDDTGEVISPPNSQILNAADAGQDAVTSPPMNSARGRPPEGDGEEGDSDDTEEASSDELEEAKKKSDKNENEIQVGSMRQEGETFGQCLERVVPDLIQNEGMDREDALQQAQRGCTVLLPGQSPEEVFEREHDHDHGSKLSFDHKDIDLKDEQIDAVRARRQIEEHFVSEYEEFFSQEFEKQQDEIKRILENVLSSKSGEIDTTKQVQPDKFDELRQGFAKMAERANERMRESVDEEILVKQINQTAKEIAREVSQPVTLSDRAASIASELTNEFTDKISDTSAARLRLELTKAQKEGVSIDELTSRINNRIDTWDASRARMIARTESLRTSNRAALEGYREAEVSQKQWLAATDACPYCASLNGKIVETNTAFLSEGEEFAPEGVDRPLNLGMGDVGHPPVHPNCRCTIVGVSR